MILDLFNSSSIDRGLKYEIAPFFNFISQGESKYQKIINDILFSTIEEDLPDQELTKSLITIIRKDFFLRI